MSTPKKNNCPRFWVWWCTSNVALIF